MSLITIDRSLFASQSDFSESKVNSEALDTSSRSSQSEDFLMCKATAVGLSIRSKRRCSQIHPNDDIQDHLKKILGLLRFGDYVQLVVRLQSEHPTPHHHRYCCVISTTGKLNTEESAILGIDITNSRATIGLVLPIWQDMSVRLYGDGGLELLTKDTEKQLRPVSVQALWAAFQAINRACLVARTNDYYSRGLTHDWVGYYHNLITSTVSQIQEWLKTDDIDSFNHCVDPNHSSISSIELDDERAKTEALIRVKLQAIMYTVDLEEVTVLELRQRLEEELHRSFQDYRHFIEEEVLVIYGRMDEASLIYDHLLLGTTFNASNRAELERRSVSHILNVTREVDNFFPNDKFEYKNIRVFDDETSSLLPYFEETHRFINGAKSQGTCCLVHCKMGVSRSATVVIAYVMKEQNCDLETALAFVRCRRPCVQPNPGFMRELCTYQGILEASSNRHKPIFRNESPTSSRLSTNVTASPLGICPQTVVTQPQTVGCLESTRCHHMPTAVTSASTNEIDLETELFAYKLDRLSNEAPLPFNASSAHVIPEYQSTKQAGNEAGPYMVWDLQGDDLPEVRSATLVAHNSHLLRQWHPDLMENVNPNELAKQTPGVPIRKAARPVCPAESILPIVLTTEQTDRVESPKPVQHLTAITSRDTDCSPDSYRVPTYFDHTVKECSAVAQPPVALHGGSEDHAVDTNALRVGASLTISTCGSSAERPFSETNVSGNGFCSTASPSLNVWMNRINSPHSDACKASENPSARHSKECKNSKLDDKQLATVLFRGTNDKPVENYSAVVFRSINRTQSAHVTPLQPGPSRLRPDDSWIISSTPSSEAVVSTSDPVAIRRTRPVSELLSSISARRTTGTIDSTEVTATQPSKTWSPTMPERSGCITAAARRPGTFPSLEAFHSSLTRSVTSPRILSDQSFTLFPGVEPSQASTMERSGQLTSESANCSSYPVFHRFRRSVNNPPHSAHPVGADAR